MEEYSEVAKMFRRVYTKLVYDQNTSLEVFLLGLPPLKLYLDYSGDGTSVKTLDFGQKDTTGQDFQKEQ